MSNHTPGPNEVAATLKLSLRADSDYIANAEYRISANQWGAILKIAEGKISPQCADAAPELMEAAQAAESVLARQKWLPEPESTAPEAAALYGLRAAIAKASGA